MSPDPIDRIRRLCLALPEAAEQEAWDAPTFRVRRKIFAMYASASAARGASVWCKASLGVQEVLVRSEPRRYFVPPYVGAGGWIGVVVDLCGDDDLREHVVESYCLVAPRSLSAALEP
jgi:hypothetical protein